MSQGRLLSLCFLFPQADDGSGTTGLRGPGPEIRLCPLLTKACPALREPLQVLGMSPSWLILPAPLTAALKEASRVDFPVCFLMCVHFLQHDRHFATSFFT